MRVAIDKSSHQTSHRVRGVGFYTERLIKALRAVDKSNQYIFFTRGEKIPKCGLLHYPYFDLFSLTLPFVEPHGRNPSEAKYPTSLSELRGVPSPHSSTGRARGFLRRRVKSVKTVVTAHDLTPLVFPDKFPKGVKGWIRYQIQRQSLRGVNAIITDSENSKKDIIKFIGFPEAKIYTIPLASDKEFKKLEIENPDAERRGSPTESRYSRLVESRRTSTISRDWMLKTRKRYCLPEKFVLYVGDVNWNKNIPGLIKAFANIKYQISNIKNTNQKLKIKELKLVLVGKAFLDEELEEVRELNGLIDELQIGDSVLKLGFVPTKDLVKIYNLAAVYVQPSFYEGFGLPVLEAMACGTPVVCANTSSLPEIGGGAAVYIDPYKVDDIARGISEVLHYNDTYHCRKVEEGLRQAGKFSWEKTARETIRVYEKVMTND